MSVGCWSRERNRDYGGSLIFEVLRYLVAGIGLEPMPPGYEPGELPLLHPANIYILPKKGKKAMILC